MQSIPTPHRLKRLSNAFALDDGRVAFTVETEEGPALSIACEVAELGDIFSFLGRLARSVPETDPAAFPPAYLSPVPADGIGFQAGPTPDVTLLVLRLAGFAMAFEIPSNALAALAPELSRIARTLSAGGSRN